jgi:hypothetical protein
MIEREDKIWEAVHSNSNKTAKIEVRVEAIELKISEKHAHVDTALETLTNAFVGIDKKLDIFMASFETARQTKEKFTTLLLAVAGLLIGGIGYLLSFWVEHAVK